MQARRDGNLRDVALALFPFLITACSAPEIATTPQLAGSHRVVTDGPRVEDATAPPPFSAWTTAAPLTIVQLNNDNLVVLDRVAVRMTVLQVRPGRIRVRCTGCTGSERDAEGFVPRDVLWTALPDPGATSTSRSDPLTLMLELRARWAAGHDLPPGAKPPAMCKLVDEGLDITGDTAQATGGGGSLRLRRLGATWSVVDVRPPAIDAVSDWSFATVVG